MVAVKKNIDKKVLGGMIPINALSALHIEEVFAKAVIDEVASGRYVFKKGDRDNQSVYLLDGQVELLDGRKVVGKVGAGSEAAHHPLAHKQPRQLSVRASGQATVARIDSSLLDVLLTWDESSGYDVVDIEAEDDDDWMTRMLQSRAFVQLPPSSIHQLLMRLEAVTASAGDVIVNQGQDGDFFYIVKSGRLAVTRKASSRSNEVMLAELGQGDCFGEDALVSGAERNATVRMITDGWLMRLSRDDFDELLRASLVHEVSYAEAVKLVDDGTCWLDVRLPGEFSNRAIQGSINVPLSALRGQTDQLDSQCTYVVYCDTGRRSSAGAFILGQLGYQVYVLSNGLMDVPDEATSGDCPQVSAAQPDQEAEIIPFGNVTAQPEIKASDTTAADDAAFREQLETALLTNAELQQEIEDRQQQIERLIAGSELQGSEKEQLQQRIATLEASFAGEQATRASQRSELELQNRELMKEMDGLRTSAQERDQQFNELIRERDSTSGQLAQSIQEVDMLQEQLEQQLQEAGQQTSEAGEREQSLQEQLEQLDQAATAAREELVQASAATSADRQELVGQLETLQAQIDQLQNAASAEQGELGEQLQALQTQLEEQTQQLTDQQSRRKQLETRLEQQLQEAGQQASEAGEREQSLQAQLEEAGAQNQASVQQVAELEASLAGVAREHKRDIDSVRDALARAQDERENTKREQSRLMESLRKAESRLDGESHEHEAEVYRLRKELQEAEGGDGSGIAAELEAMQAQLGEARDQREHLELKLGERSAQLEQQQVQLDDMAQQVELGQQNAQQAEASACTAETERKNLQRTLDADRQKLEALNESLATTVSERDQVSEQLTVQKQELQELRVALQQMQEQESAGNQQLEQSLQARELELQSLQASIRAIEAEREAAQTAQQQARQDADRLLAEAEVTRGLLDMQAAGDSDSALREELEQVRKNVEVAVRLRSQADKKSQDLAAEVERLRTQLNASAPSAGNPGTAAMHIPSLDADDPHASVEMDTAIAALSAVEQALPPSTVSAPLLDEVPAATAPVAQGKGKSGIGMGLLAGLLIGGAVAFVVSWWLTGQQKTVASVSAVRQTGRVVLPVKAPQPTVPPVADTPRAPVARSVDRSEKKHLLASAESLPRSTPAPEPARETSPAPAVTPFSRGEPGAEAGGGAEKMPQAVVSGAEDRPEPAPVPAVVEPVVAQPGRIFSDSLTDGGSGPRMVQLNADIYLMGSGQTSANFDERPQHEVPLARFAIGQYEVTFDEYDRFAEATGRRLPADEGWGRGARPVIGVSWQDAVDYTHWLSEQTGNRYRLPTETEWEFSARTGSDKRFWWGNELEQKLANCFDCGNEAAGVKTVVVGNFAPSEWRLHDMAGNVMEWVQDCYQPDYSDMPSGGGAVELANCGNRVVRGGGYTSPGDKLRSAARDLRAPDSRLDNLGFRVVREY